MLKTLRWLRQKIAGALQSVELRIFKKRKTKRKKKDEANVYPLW